MRAYIINKKTEKLLIIEKIHFMYSATDYFDFTFNGGKDSEKYFFTDYKIIGIFDGL